MMRNERLNETLFRVDNGSVDSNKFYTILLDAKAAAVSENMCDITEKLLIREKDNAKTALDHLWNLKKNLFKEKNGTIDLLINFYQDKMDVLRNKEEHLKKISRDSRNLLEERRKHDEEIANVKQQVQECTKELNELNAKLDKLKTREQELQLIDMQLGKELNNNENEILNGLYEIILPGQGFFKNECDAPTDEEIAASSVENAVQQSPFVQISDTEVSPENESMDKSQDEVDDTNLMSNVPRSVLDLAFEQPPYPKSVVKTTGGRIIGEYYYDSSVYKNERHYIFNSRFFCEHLYENFKLLKQRFEQSIYAEILQMVEDASKRISDNENLHFEVSTNEILNDKTLKQLRLDAKARSVDEIEKFCTRLKAKIDALGVNYRILLQEQMLRCIGKK
ncbi:MAG: hypothetical protein JW915_03350 [Chitinispirillaceae bacterium]|nr:hypothetical protein [Chitinispirillaceae bacterium]